MFRRAWLSIASLMLCLFGSANAMPPETAVAAYDEPGQAQSTAAAHAELMRFLLQPLDDPHRLRGYRIAILAADGVDGFNLEVPRQFLAERGATVHVIVPRPSYVLQATGSGAVLKPKTEIAVLDPSGELRVAAFDRFVDQVQPQDYDIVYLPGSSTLSADLADQRSLAFLQKTARSGIPIFAIGNSPLVLLKAGLLDGRWVTGDEATLSGLATSSARVADQRLVSDGTIHTSRDAFDMPVLMDLLVATLLEAPARAR